jgi:hypothetical protein
MTVNFTKTAIVTLKLGDPGFTVTDGLMVADRAALVVDQKCPKHIADQILIARNQGWLSVRAHLTEEEYAWMMLQK